MSYVGGVPGAFLIAGLVIFCLLAAPAFLARRRADDAGSLATPYGKRANLIQSFQSVGMWVDKALDTDEGIAMVAHGRYDLIVEDMGRPSGKDAGYQFLDALKQKGIEIPVIVYAARMGDPKLRSEAIARGAIAATNRPSDVFRLVTSLAPRLAATRG
jgi:CheY-like chemotaxis protein